MQEIGQQDDVTRDYRVVVADGAMRCRVLEEADGSFEEARGRLCGCPQGPTVWFYALTCCA
jgi:hypothetical protein